MFVLSELLKRIDGVLMRDPSVCLITPSILRAGELGLILLRAGAFQFTQWF